MDCFICHSVARRWICGVVSRTEAKSVSLLMQTSLFIFCLHPPLAWAVRRAASLRRYYTKTHSISPMNLRSLVALYY